MNIPIRTAIATACLALATPALADAILYEHDGFAGRNFSTTGKVGNFERSGFNDRASSVVVVGDRWEACEHANFAGRCVVLRPGRYASLEAMGMNDRISSVRPVATNARVDDRRFAPEPVPVYDNRRRSSERVYEANVTSVRAVVGAPEQRCWIEHQPGTRGEANLGGAIVGALIGGVLGHQVGSGRGNDLATAGGAVAGAVVGSGVGRDGSQRGRDVQRCENVAAPGRTEYWDVTYEFRGVSHRMQTVSPPGPTVSVNRKGEPRA